ncbi:Caspase-1 [Cryptotermes secundus]|uniref:Caspase-1 n=1 Tax=Cryptotermes secundus TaxID=105785 RepID=A0A2J7PIQ1_9NEOP|nr:caspase-1 [Cryptotermes secundus]XP_023724375.1 caspase-1 [Cryptotermes secundus]XP_033611050.1 caspase-1 [Cryptotermes secundus]PNF16219.1 Caspase-1 [Cryptotermes secundus]PNF16220.1 Caspase-1 [Cryptotermes secundus]PNF16221.1 Caspase-1 [Cryptotermes secundus]PNF16222.1 Caspase-1 [Cryptotermes secundus]
MATGDTNNSKVDALDNGDAGDEILATEDCNISEVTATGVGDAGDALGQPNFRPNCRVAVMPVERNSAYYNMFHKRRGRAVIFNHEHFDIPSLKPRNGTNVDCGKLKHVLVDFGFEVTAHSNLTTKDIIRIVKQVAEEDHSECDCFLMAVLSHGEMGFIYSRDTPYKPESLWKPFTADKCPTLAGKPKLFFFQACQGDKLDGGITLRSRTEVDGDGMGYKIPIHADFLIAYSTIPGFYSWRNTTNGSWFIQALCCELEAKGTSVDILTLLTFVIQRVALDFESNTPGNCTMHQQKQIPCVTTMLTRLLCFNKK